MEEDINKLQKLIDRCKDCKFATCEQCEINWTEIRAIEHLIEEYKELREKEKTYINPSKTRVSYFDKGKGTEVVIEGFVPKSKVKEKIEELKVKPNKFYSENKKFYYETDAYNKIIIQTLEEFLEES